MNKLYIYNNGDTVTKTYTVTNGSVKQTDVKLVLTVPQGLSINSSSITIGSFDKSLKTWFIGDLEANEVVVAHITFITNNVNLSPFDVIANISSNEKSINCEFHVYIEKSLTPCTDCNKAFPIFPAFNADNGSFTNKTLNFFDSNVSFLTTVSNGSSGVIGFYDPARIYINTDYRELGDIKFQNSNGIFFGVVGSVVTASHNGLTTQFNQAVSASNSSLSFQTLYFSNTLGLSHYISDGSIFISSAIKSYSVIGNTTAQSSSNTYNNLVFSGAGDISVGISGNTLVFSANTAAQSSLSFVNSNGITFGINGSTLTASHNGLTTQSAQAVSAGNGSFAFQTLEFANLNGVTFYTTNGSLAASYTLPPAPAAFSVQAPGSTYTNSVQFVNANGVSFTAGAGGISASIATQFVTNVSNSNNVTLGVAGGLLTASVNSQTNQSLGLYALGNTTNNTSSTFDARSLSFVGAGDISVGYINGSVILSSPVQVVNVSQFPARPLPSQLSSYVSSYQYVYPVQLENNLEFNQMVIPALIPNNTINVTFNQFGNFTNIVNQSYNGYIYYNIYSLTGSTLSLYKSAGVNYIFSKSASYQPSGNGYTFSNYIALKYSFDGSSHSSVYFINSYGSATGEAFDGSQNVSLNSQFTGNKMFPILNMNSVFTLDKGMYFAMFKHTYDHTYASIQSFGFEKVESGLDFNYLSNTTKHILYPLVGVLSNSTTVSYNTSAISKVSNLSPAIYIMRKP